MNTPLIAVCGPTGSGKSALAIYLATEFPGEIVNNDSLQVYRHFDIGTAKLSATEQAGIPHYLIDVAEGGEGFTAGEYARRARPILHDIASRGRLPIVAGGTGFYLRALIDGLSAAPSADPALRERLSRREERRPGALHRILRRLDSGSAGRIHSRDIPKLIRALEIRLQTSGPLPCKDALTGFRVLKLGLFPSRDALYSSLDRRCQQMLSGGLLEEIQRILALGVARESKPFESIGYKEGLAVLEGRMSPGDALTQMQRDTRRYAKRQMTWFRHEAEMAPLAGFGTDASIQQEAASVVRQFLSSGSSTPVPEATRC